MSNRTSVCSGATHLNGTQKRAAILPRLWHAAIAQTNACRPKEAPEPFLGRRAIWFACFVTEQSWQNCTTSLGAIEMNGTRTRRCAIWFEIKKSLIEKEKSKSISSTNKVISRQLHIYIKHLHRAIHVSLGMHNVIWHFNSAFWNRGQIRGNSVHDSKMPMCEWSPSNILGVFQSGFMKYVNGLHTNSKDLI